MEKPQFNHPEFLDKKYPDLAGSKPAERATQIVGEEGETPHTRAERVEAYLDRLESVWNAKNEKGENRGFILLKSKILSEFVTDFSEIPESYWKLQENIMRERGQLGDWQSASEKQKEESKRQIAEGLLDDQRSSLEQWLDYFHLPDSSYIPKELKYWIFRSITKLSEFDKEKKEFPKRSKGTVKQFPDINYEALGYLIDAVIGKYEGKKIEWEHDIQPEERRQFEEYLEKEDFAKLYAWANELMNPIPEHLLTIKEGEWKKFDQGLDAKELTKTIRGKGTGWCTAGEQTAKTQLSAGDFYIFYSLDDNKEATIPRIAIRIENGKIAEVRGIAFKQNLDPFMGDVLKEKLDEFPDKEEYLKKEKDMEMLTDIEKKTKANTHLTKEELEFLYEINSTIEGFGYQKDPRIEEIRGRRNKFEDATIVFECTREQIATNASEVNENTKIYIGEWNPTIYQTIKQYPNITHLYESFPDKKIFKYDLQTNPILVKENIKAKLEEKGIYVSLYEEDLINKTEFSEESKNYKLVQFTLEQLGFPQGTTTDQIYTKAQELGLKLCPAEVGPQLRLVYEGKDRKLIAMKQITDPDGAPAVFLLAADSDKLRLISEYAFSDYLWNPNRQFVFLAS